MASTVTEPVAATPPTPVSRPGRRVVAVVVVVALVVGLAVAVTYRQTVRAEREALFYSALQSATTTSFETMSQIGFGQIPFDEPGLTERFALELYGEYQRSSVIITPGQSRLGEGGTSFVVLEAVGTNADLPAWVGDVSYYDSILIFGTYTNDESGVMSDVGSCLLRHGSADALLATGDTQLTSTLRMEACTRQLLAEFRML